MEIEKINDLFRQNLITVEEHEFLISKVVERKKEFSPKALAAGMIPTIGYILMITFTIDGRAIGLVPDGEARLWIGIITASIGVVFYFLSKPEIKSGKYKGIEFSNFGFGIALAILVILLPLVIMLITH